MSESNNDQSFEAIVRQMSHELRTPLTSVLGFAELLLEEQNLTEQQRDYLQTISDEARRLSTMLDHYLPMLIRDSEPEV